MSSKYDFVKVKVRIEGEHYYVLSRYLLSRMLTFSEIPSMSASKIALEVKKILVDGGNLEIAQEDLQRELFAVVKEHGFGDRNIRLFTTMTHFYTERIPLVVLVAGTGCTGKSTIARTLGSRLNNHHVVDCEVMLEALLAVSEPTAGGGMLREPLWFLDCTTQELVAEWHRRCELVAQAVAGDIEKALAEGKVLILEGSLLNIALYEPYVRKAARCNGIFLSFVLSPPPKKDRNVMVESWLGARAHLASHLSIPQLHRAMLERFDAVAAAHSRAIDAMTASLCTSPSAISSGHGRASFPSSPPLGAAPQEPSSLPAPPASTAGRRPVTIHVEVDKQSSIVNSMHGVLLDHIIPEINVRKQRREEEAAPA